MDKWFYVWSGQNPIFGKLEQTETGNIQAPDFTVYKATDICVKNSYTLPRLKRLFPFLIDCRKQVKIHWHCRKDKQLFKYFFKMIVDHIVNYFMTLS